MGSQLGSNARPEAARRANDELERPRLDLQPACHAGQIFQDRNELAPIRLPEPKESRVSRPGSIQDETLGA
ncbi:protein of unknown function [Methylorubrum extorquens]|uniref:Uncharacterized protein n=1 Tax=Methylorubrum extorquens TaxID=408 RepID=A0A2N9AV98_METEX|nr:protein of unknown function [Methylorubrum extorquens]